MEQLVKVCYCNDDGTAQVLCLRQSACSGDCHKCSGCGAVEQKLLITAQNPIGARPGEKVRLRSDSGPVLLGAAILYLMPVVLFMTGYLLLYTRKLGMLGGLAGFLAGVLLAVVYDRKVAKKKKPQYTIVGY